MQNQKQRYEMPDELLPLWGAISWRYRERLDNVDETGFVATKEEADRMSSDISSGTRQARGCRYSGFPLIPWIEKGFTIRGNDIRRGG
jgi:hypothetical protein